MLRPLLALLLAALLLPAAQAAPGGPSASRLPAPVARALRDAGLPATSLALLVAPADQKGRLLLQQQPDRPMQPGSTMKLVTSVVALDRLGPNHRGRTELLATAAPQRGVLQGDVILRGGADPELGLPQLWALLAELRWLGVQQIEGDFVLDRSLFRPTRTDRGLPPFDEAPEFPYNTIPDALMINGGLMGLVIGADDVVVQARLWPPLEGLRLDNQLQLNDRECKDWDEEWRTPAVEAQPDGTLKLTLHGAFPRRCEQRPQLQLLDRDQQAERQLRLLWQGLGGRWQGQVREGTTPPEAHLVPAANRAPGASCCGSRTSNRTTC